MPRFVHSGGGGNKIATKTMMNNLVPIEKIENCIYLLRGQKVMLDKDLAHLYGVKTFVLNQAVKRNKERFPDDFMFSLSRQEILRISQFVISSQAKNNQTLKYSKNVNTFTEQGIAMLSGILRCKRAIAVNIAIMRTFVKLRKILANHKKLAKRLTELEHKFAGHDTKIQLIFKAIKTLMSPSEKPRSKIGFLKDRE